MRAKLLSYFMKKSAFLLKSGMLILSLILFSCVKKDNSVTMPNQTYSIDENSEAGTIVCKVIASDKNDLSLNSNNVINYTSDHYVVSKK